MLLASATDAKKKLETTWTHIYYWPGGGKISNIYIIIYMHEELPSADQQATHIMEAVS
jgi:hypothetical protein